MKYIYTQAMESGNCLRKPTSNGCHFVVSDNSVFLEVCCPAVTHFNPGDLDSVYSTIHTCPCDEECRERLEKEMIQRIEPSYWDSLAKEDFAVYPKLVSNA